MGGLFGPLGGLEELPCASTLAEAPAGDDVVREVRADDGTVYIQLAPQLANRVWQLSVGTSSPEDAAILSRVRGAWHRRSGPSVWYSEAAQAENLLDPEAALMSPARWSGITPGGGGILPDDYLPGPRFLESGATPLDGTWAQLTRIPIPMNRTVTVSCVVTSYPTRSARLQVDEVALDGRTVRSHQRTTTDVRDRLSLTFPTTGQTTSLTLAAADAATVTDPQITLTDQARPWAPGAGCMNAYISAPTREVQLAVPGIPGGSLASYAWSIREIGHASMGYAG